MAYEKKTWEIKTFQKGDTELVDGLNHIEEGIASSAGGTTVVANPTLEGGEPDLTSIQVGNSKFKIPAGGSGEPAAYLKSAAVSGNTLTLTKKDDSTVTFSPVGTQLYRHVLTITDGGVVRSFQIIDKKSTAYNSILSIENAWTSFGIITMGYLSTAGTITRYSIEGMVLNTSPAQTVFSYVGDLQVSAFSIANDATVEDEVFAL